MAFAPLEQRYVDLIGAYSLNIAMPLEQWGQRIPVLFGSRELLLAWAHGAPALPERWNRSIDLGHADHSGSWSPAVRL